MMINHNQKPAVQKEAFPLARMITFDNIFRLKAADSLLSVVKVFGLSGFTGLLANVSPWNLTKPHIGNLTKPDIHRCVMLANVDIETAPAGLYATVRAREDDSRKGYSYEYTRMPVRAREEFLQSIKKGSISSATLSHTANCYQPFGSMPKRSSSLRPSVLSQLAKLIPDSAATDSNCSLSSGVIRILNCGDCPSPFGLLSRFIIDRWSPIELVSPLLGGHLIIVLPIKTMPRSGGTLTGHLTTTVINSNEEAILNSNTPQQVRHSHTLNTGTELPSFIWIIAAVRRDCQTITAQIHHIEAESEREARQTLAREHVTFFAGRIRKGGAHD